MTVRNLCSLLLFVARDRSPRVALALAGKLAANAAARLLRRPEPYRRPFRGASLNLTGLKAELRSATRPPPPPRREPPTDVLAAARALFDVARARPPIAALVQGLRDAVHDHGDNDSDFDALHAYYLDLVRNQYGDEAAGTVEELFFDEARLLLRGAAVCRALEAL